MVMGTGHWALGTGHFLMRVLRIIIVILILIALGTFFWLTAGSDPETLLLDRLLVLTRTWSILCSARCLHPAQHPDGSAHILPLPGHGFSAQFYSGPAHLLGGEYCGRHAPPFTWCDLLSQHYFQEKYGYKKLIRRINKRIQKYGLWSVVFSRGIYILPTNMINFSFPLSNITARTYLAGTILGLLPECLINVLTGYLIKHEVILLSSPESDTWQALVIGGFILLFALVFILLRVRQNHRKKFKSIQAIPYKR